jgi:HK97 family phage portal protein
MFPEIRKGLREFFGDNGAPISLNLKTTGNVLNFASTVEEQYLRKFPTIYEIVAGGGPAWSGETVNIDTALQHPVVWACNAVVAGTMGTLPATLKQVKNGQIRDAIEHPMYSAMQDEPNEESTSQSFRELLTTHALFTGNGYAQVIRRSGGSGTAIQLRTLLPENVNPARDRSGRLVYVVSQAGNSDKVYTVEPNKAHDILHIRGAGWDGLKGYPVIRMMRQSVGTAIAAERNVAEFWANGGRIPYHLETTVPFKDENDANLFRANWNEKYGKPHVVPILPPGITYEQDGLNMKDAQALEFRQDSTAVICRYFDVLPHLVGDLSRATFNNIEQLALQFEKLTLSKWLTRWNKEFRRCVLTPEEKAARYYLHHNLDALRRGDFVARMTGYATALQNGWLNRDEVRELEDRNPIPDGAGADYTIQLNMQGLPLTDAADLAKQLQKKPPTGGN